MVSLLRQIIQNSPQITKLNMTAFSRSSEDWENIGKLVLEVFLNSNIDSIADLNLSGN